MNTVTFGDQDADIQTVLSLGGASSGSSGPESALERRGRIHISERQWRRRCPAAALRGAASAPSMRALVNRHKNRRNLRFEHSIDGKGPIMWRRWNYPAFHVAYVIRFHQLNKNSDCESVSGRYGKH